MPRKKNNPSKQQPNEVREVEAEIVGIEKWTPRDDEPPEEFELDEIDHESGPRVGYYRVHYHNNGCGCCGCLPFMILAIVGFFFIYGLMAFFGR